MDVSVRRNVTGFMFIVVNEPKDLQKVNMTFLKITKLGFNTTVSVEKGIDELVNALSAVEYKTPYTNI